MTMTGFRPFGSRKTLTNVDDPDDLDEDKDNVEEGLRLLVREQIVGIYVSGMKKSTMDDIKKNFPNFYGYLEDNYSDYLSGCSAALRTKDLHVDPMPYVVLPDENSTVVSWDSKKMSPNYEVSADLCQAIGRLK
jgi:hypothetical protein